MEAEAPSPPPRIPYALALGALGVVYGDLGTNPLFALGEAFGGEHGVPAERANVLGVLSLVFWALTLVITVKYLSFVMRAANDGEGGILALLGLIPKKARPHVLVLVILFGASLLYGDGVVTPAISVLSAVEGVKAVAPGLGRWVVPITVAILAGLFWVQRRGTHGIGVVFGPVMVVWFVVIGVLGAVQIAGTPTVLAAISPTYAVALFVHDWHAAFSVLGAIILCIAGGEALYADMGHFGRRPIVLAWYAIVFPCLLLNYFGQGAFILTGGQPHPSFFYSIVPEWGIIPMIALSAMATVIASQALISGAYSLTQQAVQLGFCPRVAVVHTHEEHSGQIYVPEVNWALMIACIALVVAFQSSDRLAAAYGLAVTGTMSVTTLAYFVVTTQTWRWPMYKALAVCLPFLAIDGTFLVANLRKFLDGGFVPFFIGLSVFVLMTTWMKGRQRLGAYQASLMEPLDRFLERVARAAPPRVPGTAVFLTASSGGAPVLLIHHFKHNQVLHETVILLTLTSTNTPFVKPNERFEIEGLGQGFYRLIAHFGYMENPQVPDLVLAARTKAVPVDPQRITYYMGRETLLVTNERGMARWRKLLFSFVSRNARSATAYFGIPADRVVELGMQIEL